MVDLVSELQDGIAVVTLNRPAKRNAVTLAMWTELARLFADFAQAAEVRGVVLTGAGGHFSGGADIAEFATVRANAAQGEAYERQVDGAVLAIRELPKPTVAAIDGFCVGGGLALAMACDFRVAAIGARFAIPAARLGIVYGLLDCRALADLVGIANAKRILFRGAQFDAEEAARLGLVDRLAGGAALSEARALLEPMVENAPLSIAGMKLILNALADGSAGQRAHEIDAAILRSMDSTDYREAARAFVEKRQPRFTGN